MKRSMAAVVSLVLCLCAQLTALPEAATVSRIRCIDAWASESLERGLKGSALVRSLVSDLNVSDLIVHVESTTTLPFWIGGTTRFVTSRDEFRYMRITLDRDALPDDRAATLAHELQHAWEFAQSAARSHADMLTLYQRIGHRVEGQRTYYETTAAERAGKRARAEIKGYGVAVGIQR